MGQTGQQVLFENRLRRHGCLQASKHGCFGFLETIPLRLFFLPKRAGAHQRSLFSALPASPTPTWLSTYPSLGAIHCCRLYNDTGFTFRAKADQKIKQPDGEAEGRIETAGLCVAEKDFRGCFCMKNVFSLSFVSASPFCVSRLLCWRGMLHLPPARR